MSKPRILVTEADRFSARAQAILREVGELKLANLDRPGLLQALRDVEVLWVRLRNRIDAEIISQAPQLRFILSATTGLNHIDLVAAEHLGIRVLSLRGEMGFLRGIRATAEHTVALILSLLRCLPTAVQHVQSGGWNRDLFWGHELHGKNVGIIGYGRLGHIVGEYLGLFGARVMVTDPTVSPQSLAPGVRLMTLDSLLEQADIITIHADLNDNTKRFFGPEQFAKIKNGAWFVNTARGELIDEAALLEALEKGHLTGAAVDVLTNESSGGMGTNSLVRYAKTHDNLLITPHIGGCTFESVEKTEIFLAEKLRACLMTVSSEIVQYE